MAWDPTRNGAFMARVYGFASQLRALTWEAYQIAGLYQANGVGDDDTFVDARGVAKTDAEAIVAVAADLIALVRDGTVTQADREAVINRVLGGPLN
jgi:phenylalanyl-tRNA synthetase beta subunit